MTMLLEFLERHRARYLFRSSHLNPNNSIAILVRAILLLSSFRFYPQATNPKIAHLRNRFELNVSVFLSRQ